jgi:AcrR family transcriptional regulator
METLVDDRDRIIACAIQLLTTGGREALTTRAVAAAAAVQAPTIYRLFGDKDGLLDAVAEHGYAAYTKQKHARKPGVDAIADLRAGWDLHIAFGLANPAIYAIMIGSPGTRSPAAIAAYTVLADNIHRIAVAGRLRVAEPRAAELVHAAGSGTVLALLATPPDRRDPGLSDTAREAVIAAITTADKIGKPTKARGTKAAAATAAIALRAVLPDDDSTLSAGERLLLAELLDRLAVT